MSVVLEGQRRFELIVKLKEPYRSDAYKLGELRLELPSGRGQIRLREVADFPTTASGPNLVNRENVRRRQTIRCNLSGRDLDSTVEITVNHDKKECYVLVTAGDDEKAKPLPVAAKEFTLTTKETKTKEGKVVPPLTIKLLPHDAKDGKAAKFVGTDPGLGNVADFAGTVGGEIAGKPSSGEFKE